MKPGTDKILARALRAAERAEAHLAAGAADRACERAYHAIVHAARALLNEVGDRSRAHAAIAVAIEKLVPAAPEAVRDGLTATRRWRDAGDGPSLDDAERLVALARSAVESARVRIEPRFDTALR